MELADIKLIDDPYTLHLITPATLDLAPPLADLTADQKYHLCRLAEGVVESVINLPEDLETSQRRIARARWQETVTFECDRPSWRLGRAPVSIVAATLDGAPFDLDELRVQGATGVIRPVFGGWRAGERLVVDYDAGWLTPAQTACSAPPDFGPTLPQPIIGALLRAAMLGAAGLARDPAMTALREVDTDAGEIETRFGNRPLEAGTDADIFAMLAPWRRMVLA